MAYYVYPVYVLATLIVLILTIIFIIYTLHFYKFVKSRIVFIKLESEDNNLNNWTFDLYPFTSSRIWKVFGYAIVCLPATFQQASTILVCQCKVIKFKTVLPKSVCDDTKGIVTPALVKKKFAPIKDVNEEGGESNDCGSKANHVLKTAPSPGIVIEKAHKNEETVDDKEHDCKCLHNNDSSVLKANENLMDRLRTNTISTETLKQPEKAGKQRPEDCCEQQKKTVKSLPGKIMQSLRKSPGRSPSRPKSTVIDVNPEANDPNISIMSIDNLCESDYFIIPEAKPLQKLVVFNEPFNSSCPICLDDFELDEEIALLACHHGYHKDCLNKALRQNASCPYCKSESNVRAFRVAEEIPLLWQTMSRRNSSAVNV